MTLALGLSLLLLTVGKYLFQSKFMDFLILPFNNKYILLSHNKGRLFGWFHIFVTLFQFLNFSLFLYLLKQMLESSNSDTTFYPFLMILGLVVLLQTIKISLQVLKGYAFNSQELILDVVFTKITYLNYSSLIMFLGNILLIFVFKESMTLIYTVIILIFSVNAIGLIRLIKNHQNVIVLYLFYFILYLCALEIAPLVVIGSYLKG